MGYKDEELLQMRQKIEEFKKQQTAEETIEQECAQSIHDPVVYITKLPVEFKDRPLLGERITMRIPVDFELVPPEIVEQVFYMQSKPQFVYENPYLPLGLAFNLTEVAMDEEKLNVLYPYILSMLKKIGPGVRVLSSDKKRVHDIAVLITEFIAQTMTEPTYNQQFTFILDGKMVAGNLICPSVFMKRYKPIMEEMIETLCIPTETATEEVPQ